VLQHVGYQTQFVSVDGTGRKRRHVCRELYGTSSSSLPFLWVSLIIIHSRVAALKHPLELVKVRIQASGLGIVETCKGVMRNEGIAAFWKGLAFAYGVSR
jgi:hypothetical protein